MEIVYGWAVSQKFPKFNFKWVENTSQFKEDFIKTKTKKLKKDIFLKSVLNIQKNYMNFIVTFIVTIFI